jgi:non-ribosomal peptide synthetase component F
MVEYDASLFSESRITLWVKWLLLSFEQAERLGASHSPVDTLSLLDESELYRVIEEFNQTQDCSVENTFDSHRLSSHTVPIDTTVPELFEQQVARTPDATALVFGETQITYRELNQRSNQLAHHLISLGSGPEKIVALALPRSIEFVIALLAVLKSGAAYLPLDPDYPSARLTFMLTDSDADLIISDYLKLSGSELHPVLFPAKKHSRFGAIVDLSDAGTLQQINKQNIDRKIARLKSSIDNLSYLVYTSGSSGLPKGVGGTAKALANRLTWGMKQLPFADTEAIIGRSSFAFIIAGPAWL